MIDHTKLIDMVRRTPGIRTIQLCDQLDCDIEELLDTLNELVAENTIVEYPVIAPNGRDAKAYRLVGVNAILPTPVKNPDALAKAEKTKTKVEIAIDFISAQPDKKATASQLHTLLGLKASEYPSSYLTAGTADGRLIKDGKNWTLGSAAVIPKASPAKPAPAAETKTEIPLFLQKQDQPAPVEQPKQPAPHVEEPVLKIDQLTRLQVQLTPVPVFDVQIGDTKIEGMREISEWNGFKELRDAKGRKLIVVVADGIDLAFGGIFSQRVKDVPVISGHPDFVAILTGKKVAA